ncbi:hypothetical protein Q5H92_07195 [Hymenobacter sp. M29]|uniref:Uncharacterized protein n=1 Tax=Hymenobacter mellowenesis TaxID=3063995 RepID=A0ABT9A8G7_9BACT|nr:hypothetical protein [Hymenobacter sp. M29]MDO7846133.1 hypothetical protein [Hymenobacter sp. M29]
MPSGSVLGAKAGGCLITNRKEVGSTERLLVRFCAEEQPDAGVLPLKNREKYGSASGLFSLSLGPEATVDNEV